MMLRLLFFRHRYLVILVTFLLLVGAIPPVTSFARLTTTPSANPTWTASGNLLLSRISFRATTLQNGKVLIEGGFAPGSYTTDSELFDPTTGVWTQTGSLNQGRGEHSATLLQDGRVLVVGGYAGPVLTSSELYDPTTGSWTLTTGSMSQPRTRHTATLLPDGKVLVAGGWDGNMVSSAEIYDPATESWSGAGNMAITRADHSAVLLPNGQVLVAGGAPFNNDFTAEAELYDTNTNTWTPTGSMNVARVNFTAVLLTDGKVLAIGGNTPTGPTATAELYDPATGTWTLTGSMQNARSDGLGQQAMLLADGSVLVAGGDTGGTSEVYNPANGTWNALTTMVTPQCDGATALLRNGQVLLTGGNACTSGNTLVATELYTSVPETLWGVDSYKHITATFYSSVQQAFGTPDFWGRYIGLGSYKDDMKLSEVTFAHSNGLAILPVYSDYNPANVKGYTTGQTYATTAIEAAQQILNISPGVAIFVDIEGGETPDAAFLEGWYDTFNSSFTYTYNNVQYTYQSGYYKAGYYGNTRSKNAFTIAYCQAVNTEAQIGTNAFIWTPQPNLGRTSKATAPAYTPIRPACANQVFAWQYGILGSKPTPPDVDTDEVAVGLPLWHP